MFLPQHLLFILVTSTGIIITTKADNPCTVCPNGEPITTPDKQLLIPGFEVIENCQQLEETISLFLVQNDTECKQFQSLGTICGCPIPQPEQEACHLCGAGDSHATLEFPHNEIPLFRDLLPGNFTPNCEIAMASLHTVNKNDALCRTSQSLLSSYCGCSNHVATASSSSMAGGGSCKMCRSGVRYPNKTINLFGFETCGELDGAVEMLLQEGSDECSVVQSISGLCGCDDLPSEPCTICRDGTATVPDHLFDKEIPFLDPDAAPLGVLGVAPTCGTYAAYLQSLPSDDEKCPLAQGIGSYCGCAPVENHCNFCPGHPIDPSYYNKTLHFLSPVKEAGVLPTCEFAETMLKQVPSNDLAQCFAIQQRSFLCGCNDGVWMYAETKNNAQKLYLSWAPRVTGTLSILGASFILMDVLGSKQRRQQVYCQILLGMAVFDIITAIPWIVSTSAIPRYVDGGDPSGVLGARGTEATCRTQAFFVQLGLATIVYNIALAVYYNLVIVWGWRQQRLKQIRYWLHGTPIAIGCVFASATLQYYSWHPLVCFLPVFPWGEVADKTMGLVVVPICVSILIISALMVSVYWKVRRQFGRAAKYLYGAGSMHEKVLWQSVSYVMAFLVAWPIIVAVVFHTGMAGSIPYWEVALLATVGPLQGFMNAVVYFRPRVSFTCCTDTANQDDDVSVMPSEIGCHGGQSDVDQQSLGGGTVENVGDLRGRMSREPSFRSICTIGSHRSADRDGRRKSYKVLQITATSYDPSIVIACEQPTQPTESAPPSGAFAYSEGSSDFGDMGDGPWAT